MSRTTTSNRFPIGLLILLLVAFAWQWGCGRVVASSTTTTTASSTTTNTIPDIFSISFNPAKNIGLACGEDGLVLQSVDSGETWAVLSSPSLEPLVEHKVDLYTVYCYPGTTDSDSSLSGQYGVYLQSDDNVAWNQAGEWNHSSLTADTIYYVDSISGTNSELVVCGGGKIFRSEQYQQNYTQVASGTTVDLKHFASGDSGVVVVVGERGTILRSANSGESFASVTAEVFPDLNMIFYGNGKFYCLGDSGTFLSSDNGTVWERISLSGLPANIDFYSVGIFPPYGFLLGSGGKVVLTRDLVSGEVVQMQTNVDLLSGYGNEDGFMIIVGRDMTMLKTSNGGSIWRTSTDGGATWGAPWAITLP